MMPRSIMCIQRTNMCSKKRSKSILCLPIVKQTSSFSARFVKRTI